VRQLHGTSFSLHLTGNEAAEVAWALAQWKREREIQVGAGIPVEQYPGKDDQS
jgi:hypothetical protein